MRRCFGLVVLAAALLLSRPVYASDVRVLVDGLPVVFDAPPLVEEGRVLVPLETMAAALGADVCYREGLPGIVTVTGGGTSIVCRAGAGRALVNGRTVPLDVPVRMVDGRTFVPLHFLAESLDGAVNWDEASRTVRVASARRPMQVVGFYALGDERTSSWRDLFGRSYPEAMTGNTDLVDEVAVGWYSVERDGRLVTESWLGFRRPEGWERVLEQARARGLRVEMAVHQTDAGGCLSALLADPAAVELAVDSIAREAAWYEGVNLDLEGLGLKEPGPHRAAFVRFCARLRGVLRSLGKSLTLTLHAPNTAFQGYDYRALADLCDRIIVMAYEYGPRPEPDALVEEAVRLSLASGVPAHKLILGISAASETAASIGIKVGIAKRYRLAGVAIWRLGLVSDDMYRQLRTAIIPAREPAQVFVGGRRLVVSPVPQELGPTVFLPAMAILQAAGVEATWEGVAGPVRVKGRDGELLLPVGASFVSLPRNLPEGIVWEPRFLPCPTFAYAGEFFVPADLLVDMLIAAGCEAAWEAGARTFTVEGGSSS